MDKIILALYKVLAAKKTYYHGTSSKFLKNILKQGVIPETKEGVWKEDGNADAINPSRKSLGGSYWAERPSTADRYAGDASRKLGGNRLYIAASLETKTSIPDEDDFISIINRGIGKLWGEDYNTSGEPAVMFNYLSIRLGKKAGRDAIANWRKIVTSWLDPIMGTDKYKTNEFYKILDRVLVSELERKLSHLKNDGMYNYAYYMRTELDRLISGQVDVETYLKRFPKLTPEEGEEGRRKYVDLLCRKTKKVVEQERNIGGTLRILTPVKFSGANHITMIMEAIEHEKEGRCWFEFKVHYGTIPSEFLTSWKEMMGYPYEIAA